MAGGGTVVLPMVVLSYPQELTVLCIGWFTASCSIVGSSCILYLIKQQGSLNPFRRLMLGLSLGDILNSFWLLWQGVLVPKETSPRIFAIGNGATCSMLGFFTQLGFSVAFYNCMISFHHLLTIRYSLSPKQIAQKYEPFMHAIAILYPLTTAIIGVSLGVFNETFVGAGCWVADYPQGCGVDPNIECLGFQVGFAFAGGPVAIIFIIIVVNMFRIHRHVHRTYSRGARRSVNASMQSNRVQQVATQAYLFVLVYFLTFLFGYVTQCSEAAADDETWNEQSIFPFIVLYQIFYPSQGLFNFFIYIRPRYVNIRTQNPGNSRWWAFQQTLKPQQCQDFNSVGSGARSAFWYSGSSLWAFPSRPIILRQNRSSDTPPPSKVAPEPSSPVGSRGALGRFIELSTDNDNLPVDPFSDTDDSVPLGLEPSDPIGLEVSVTKDLDISGSINVDLDIESLPDVEVAVVEPMPEVQDVSDDAASK